MTTAYLGLGSNLDNPRQQVLKAMDELNQFDSVEVTKRSSLYDTKPVGPRDQPGFINAVIEIETTLSPQQLLCVCQRLENQHGRERKRRWGERTLDIDILLYADQYINQPDLVIPHSHMMQRDFVLQPLAEISPAIVSRMKESC